MSALQIVVNSWHLAIARLLANSECYGHLLTDSHFLYEVKTQICVATARTVVYHHYAGDF